MGRPFFEDAGRRVAGARRCMLPLMLPYVAAARTDFLRVEAVALCAALLRQTAADKVRPHCRCFILSS